MFQRTWPEGHGRWGTGTLTPSVRTEDFNFLFWSAAQVGKTASGGSWKVAPVY